MNKLAIIFSALALIYTRAELNELRQDHISLQARYLIQADKIDEIYKISSTLDQETIAVLIDTVDRLDSAIEIYDGNVDIYDENFAKLESVIEEISGRVDYINAWLVNNFGR